MPRGNQERGIHSPLPDGQNGPETRQVSPDVRRALGMSTRTSRGLTTSAGIEAVRAARGIPQIEVHRKPGRLKKVGQWALTALAVFGVGAEVADQALNHGRVTNGAIHALEQPLSSHASSGGHVSGHEGSPTATATANATETKEAQRLADLKTAWETKNPTAFNDKYGKDGYNLNWSIPYKYKDASGKLVNLWPGQAILTNDGQGATFIGVVLDARIVTDAQGQQELVIDLGGSNGSTQSFTLGTEDSLSTQTFGQTENDSRVVSTSFAQYFKDANHVPTLAELRDILNTQAAGEMCQFNIPRVGEQDINPNVVAAIDSQVQGGKARLDLQTSHKQANIDATDFYTGAPGATQPSSTNVDQMPYITTTIVDPALLNNPTA